MKPYVSRSASEQYTHLALCQPHRLVFKPNIQPHRLIWLIDDYLILAHFRFLLSSRIAGCCSFADGTRRRCSLESALPAMPMTLALTTRGTSQSLLSPAPTDSPLHRRRSGSKGVTLQATHGSRLYPHAYGNQSPRTRILYHISAFRGKSAPQPITVQFAQRHVLKLYGDTSLVVALGAWPRPEKLNAKRPHDKTPRKESPRTIESVMM